MMRSMFSAVSGLRNHQVRMDVIGNNIANVNTVGFKGSRVTFQDMVYELLKSPSATSDSLGGSNPEQAGLGMMVRSIDTLMTQGSLESTGKSTDVAIQGEGFFVLDTGQGQVYTRTGAFDVNLKKDLVDPSTGFYVMGWEAGNNPTNVDDIDTSLKPTHINIPMGQLMTAKTTSEVQFTGNLDADSEAGTIASATIMVYDTQGTGYPLTINFTKSDTDNRWTYAVTPPDGVTISSGDSGEIAFTSAGTLDAENSTIPLMLIDPGNGAIIGEDQDDSADSTEVSLDFSKAIQFAASKSDILANNSGELHYSPPAFGATGSLVSGSLEMANVDLSREFTNMIITQRGFQANSRIISTSDEMLQELVNLKR
ncbi:MAG: flagellar hook-basal body complex protein [Rubrobacteridae bacterium]|nr:flagellar hook-basal body complex protein [Rubrobacteridae bacterium]